MKTDLTLEAAAAFVRSRGTASTALLQAHFLLNYTDALEILERLEQASVVSPENFAGFRFLSPGSYTPRSFNATPMQRHARMLRDLALYVVESLEEGHLVRGEGLRIVADRPRQYGLDAAILDRVRGTRPEGAAAPVLASATSLCYMEPFASISATFDSKELEGCLERACQEVEREFRPVDSAYIPHRALTRLVRFWEMRLLQGWTSGWSRTEPFIADQMVPHGQGHNGGRRREHVVPTNFLRDRAMDLIGSGVSLEEIARWLRPYIVIVRITEEERQRVDSLWKNQMPDDWSFESGCIYARLHGAKIGFTPPPESGACRCLQ